ncbi:APC family permease [Paenibacillus vietnamensis]|uniref:APC family permease n=1 Tax=Paenibacillus vietnamensis TaxID=2590547 RepID=UPI001CD074E7|nr:APC family permease [Paenibacillus vietnamensis]
MEEKVTFKRTLTLFQVVALGLAWMSPMIYFTVYGIAYESSHGLMTSSYIVAAAAILITALSYIAMSRAFPSSASAYTYVKKAIHPYAGFLVGWVVLLEYIFSPVISCLTFGLYMHAQFPEIPASVWIVSLSVIFAALNIVGIRFSAGLSKIFVIAQIAFVGLFCLFLLKAILAPGGVSAAQALPVLPGWSVSAVLAGASLVCFSFLGFDTVTTLADETIDARRTIPKAILWIVLIASALYILISILTKLAFPVLSFANADSAGYELVKLAGGAGLQAIFMTVLLLSVFTQGVIAVTSASRLLHVMGSDSTLPKRIFGRLHPRFKTPVNSIIVVCAISLLALCLSLETSIKFVSLGALTAFVFVNASVVAQLFMKERRRSPKETCTYLVLPLIGAGFTLWLLTLLDKTALTMGLIWLLSGIAYRFFRSSTLRAPLTQKRRFDWLRREG